MKENVISKFNKETVEDKIGIFCMIIVVFLLFVFAISAKEEKNINYQVSTTILSEEEGVNLFFGEYNPTIKQLVLLIEKREGKQIILNGKEIPVAITYSYVKDNDDVLLECFVLNNVELGQNIVECGDYKAELIVNTI